MKNYSIFYKDKNRNGKIVWRGPYRGETFPKSASDGVLRFARSLLKREVQLREKAWVKVK